MPEISATVQAGNEAFKFQGRSFTSFNTQREFGGLGHTTLTGGYYYGSYPGYRFTDLPPPGSTIVSAELVITGLSVERGTAPFGYWYGDDVDSASSWTTGNKPIDQITRTTAKTLSDPQADGDAHAIDWTSIVQELVDRPGFTGTARFAAGVTGAQGWARFNGISYYDYYNPEVNYSATLDITYEYLGWQVVGTHTFTIAEDSTNTDISLPGSIEEGDIVIVALACDASLISGGSPDGGVDVAEGYTIARKISTAVPGHEISYKIMGSTPDTTVRIDGNSVEDMAGLIYVIRGADVSTPLDVAITVDQKTTGMPDAPSITPTTDGCVILAFGFLDDDDAASGVTAPNGFINLLAEDTGNASTTVGATVMGALAIQETAGAIDPAAFGGTGTDFWRAATIALRPASEGGGGEDVLEEQDLDLASTVTDTPTLSVTHNLSEQDLDIPSIEVGSPPIGQLHELAEQNLDLAGTEVPTPSLEETSQLAEQDLDLDGTSVDTPTITQHHAIASTEHDLEPTEVGTPAISQVHQLTANDLTLAETAIGTPSLLEGELMTVKNLAKIGIYIGTHI